MLLFKLPMDVFQEVMTVMHHERPQEEADKIRLQMENLQNARDSNGLALMSPVEGEGSSNCRGMSFLD
jgi:hypothetical protein